MAATRFADRRAAGQALGERLSTTDARQGDTVVLGLPRGGVLVAAGVAAALGVPMDVLVVRKLGLPWQPELAMGAIAAVGDTVETVRVDTVLAAARVDPETFETVWQQELAELRRREAAYRDGRPPMAVAGRTVIVVDDGLATGATMQAAVVAVRRQAPRGITPRFPSAHRPPVRRSATSSTNWSASPPRAGSGRSARPMPTSPRPPTPRSVPPSPTPRARRLSWSAGSGGGLGGPAVPCLTCGPRLVNRRLVNQFTRLVGGSWRLGGGADVRGATTGMPRTAERAVDVQLRLVRVI